MAQSVWQWRRHVTLALVVLGVTFGTCAQAQTKRLLVTIAQDVRTDSSRTRVYNSRSGETAQASQSVQVLDNHGAMIHFGQTVPVYQPNVSRTITPGGYSEQIGTAGYVSTGTGYYVWPRVKGDTVTVQVSHRRDGISPHGTGAIDTQQLTTIVSGRLGEWIDLGGAGESYDSGREVVLGRTSSVQPTNRRLFLKVEEIR